MSTLSETKCTACEAQATPLNKPDIAELLKQLPTWQVENRDGILQLENVYKFSNFRKALAFTNRIGAFAEEEGHHPALLTEWGKVTVTWWSHSIKGLHKNDFVMAARTDKAFNP